MPFNPSRVARALRLVALAAVLAACAGAPISYPLREDLAPRAPAKLPIEIAVADIADTRPAPERDRAARQAAGDDDLNDYTYDQQFRPTVAGQISTMLIEHMRYAGVFDGVTPLAAADQAVTDAVLAGELRSFYGYYDQNTARTLLYTVPLGLASALLLNFTIPAGDGASFTYYWYGPGMLLGYWLESRHTRDIRAATALHVTLTCRGERSPAWERTIQVEEQVRERRRTSAVGVAIESLRGAVNQLVAELSALTPAPCT